MPTRETAIKHYYNSLVLLLKWAQWKKKIYIVCKVACLQDCVYRLESVLLTLHYVCPLTNCHRSWWMGGLHNVSQPLADYEHVGRAGEYQAKTTEQNWNNGIVKAAKLLTFLTTCFPNPRGWQINIKRIWSLSGSGSFVYFFIFFLRPETNVGSAESEGCHHTRRQVGATTKGEHNLIIIVDWMFKNQIQQRNGLQTLAQSFASTLCSLSVEAQEFTLTHMERCRWNSKRMSGFQSNTYWINQKKQSLFNTSTI